MKNHLKRILSLQIFCVAVCLISSVSSIGTYMNAFLYGHKMRSQISRPRPIYNLPFNRTGNLGAVDEKHSLCNGIDIRELTILKIQELFQSNLLTSVALTSCYLERIDRMNGILKAVIEINPDAFKEAHEADMEMVYWKGSKSPMHGIPVLLKDNIDTFDKMETTAGSLALLGIRPKRDAEIVEQLRKKGAVIIGKSNLSEFAYFRGSDIPSGWSGRGGQTLNAYNLTNDPEGSSSGSASGVAANLCTVAIGTETDGSLVAPSSVEGICTVKATIGLASTRGVIPISFTQDNVGPMTRTVMDMAILFDAMLPSETKDRWACQGSYMQCILQKDLKKLRLGILRSPFYDLSQVDSPYLEFELPQLNNIIDFLKTTSVFDVIDPVEGNDLLEKVSYFTETTVLLHEFKHGINEYLKNDIISPYAFQPYEAASGNRSSSKRIASLEDIIQYNIDHPVPEGYNQDLLISSQATDGINNKTYLESRETNRQTARNFLDSVLIKYELDAIVVPSEPRVDSKKSPFLPMFADSIAAIAGYPSVVIPAGIGLNSVPFGMNFIGRPFTEGRLFHIAHIIEQMTGQRRLPKFLI